MIDEFELSSNSLDDTQQIIEEVIDELTEEGSDEEKQLLLKVKSKIQKKLFSKKKKVEIIHKRGLHKLLELPDELAIEPAIITKNGKPVMVALSLSQFESVLETMNILFDRDFATQLQEGMRQADAGETISLKDLKAELGF